jgi:hypothetical protein
VTENFERDHNAATTNHTQVETQAKGVPKLRMFLFIRAEPIASCENRFFNIGNAICQFQKERISAPFLDPGVRGRVPLLTGFAGCGCYGIHRRCDQAGEFSVDVAHRRVRLLDRVMKPCSRTNSKRAVIKSDENVFNLLQMAGVKTISMHLTQVGFYSKSPCA